MCKVKTIKYENATVNIHDDYIPKDQEQYKKNLRYLYDTLNLVFKNKDCDNLFYTEEEIEELKDDPQKQKELNVTFI